MSRRAGVSLVEVLVAMSIAAASILALTRAMLAVAGDLPRRAVRLEAEAWAIDGIESLRATPPESIAPGTLVDTRAGWRRTIRVAPDTLPTLLGVVVEVGSGSGGEAPIVLATKLRRPWGDAG